MADEVVTAEVAAPTSGDKKKIRGFVDLIKAAWDLFVAGWQKTTALVGILLGGLLVIGLLAFGPTVFSLLSQQGVANPTLPTGNIVVLVIGLVVLVVYALITGLALTRSVLVTGSGKPESVQDSLMYALHNFLPFLGLAIAIGIFVELGLILLIIPGIILALMYSQFTQVFVLEGNHSFSALSRSAEITKGYKWVILGRFFLYGLVVGVITSILGYIPLVGFVLPFITAPLGVAYGYMIYKDLLSIKG